MAADILAYLLKSNAVLLLFAAAYYGLLRRLTFFGLNRAYLLLALLFAAVYPALPVPALLPAQVLPLTTALTQPGGTIAPTGVVATAAFDWQALLLGLYAAGTSLLLLRLLAQLVSLAQVRQRSRASWVLGQPVQVLPGASGPFSFGRTIYLSEATLADMASLPAALRHEQAHVRQYHTLDVLLTQMVTALAWANPAAWLLRRAVLDNLEYLADRAALHAGLDRRAYQYSLLRQQPGGVPAPALAFHFSFLTLKNRITMLNRPASTARQLGRYLLAAPLVMALALGYSGAHAQVAPTPAPAQKSSPRNADYYLDGHKTDADVLTRINPDDISYINVIKGAEQQKLFGTTGADGTIIVTTKTNANAPEVVAFNNRLNAVKPLVPATAEQNAAVAAIKAYMTKTYPAAMLQIVGPYQQQVGRYQAIFTDGGKRLQLLFDGQGQPVKQ
jgi:hypothetical protein